MRIPITKYSCIPPSHAQDEIIHRVQHVVKARAGDGQETCLRSAPTKFTVLGARRPTDSIVCARTISVSCFAALQNFS